MSKVYDIVSAVLDIELADAKELVDALDFSRLVDLHVALNGGSKDAVKKIFGIMEVAPMPPQNNAQVPGVNAPAKPMPNTPANVAAGQLQAPTQNTQQNSPNQLGLDNVEDMADDNGQIDVDQLKDMLQKVLR